MGAQRHKLENVWRRSTSMLLRLSSTALMLAGCSNATTPFPDLPRLSVTTQFDIQNLCDIGVSPQIRLSSVPDSATNYVVQITDIDVLIESPWRENIPLASKSEIPEGAAKTFVGPCIGDNLRFAPLAPSGYRFRVEVLAEDAAAKPLAYGSTTVYVQSPYLAARRLRQRLQQPGPGATAPAAAPTQIMPSPAPSPYSGFGPGPSPNYGILQ